MPAGERSVFNNVLSETEGEVKASASDVIVPEEFPAPSIMKAYNDAFENGAYQIFLERQKILDHKIAMEKLAIHKILSQKRSGQTYGFIIALCFLIASFILILLGYGIYGTILGSVNLITLVTIFVLNKNLTGNVPNEK